MNVFIIPSWYPCSANPYIGIFIQEQAMLYAQHFPDHNVGISTWGQSDPDLLLEIADWNQIPTKIVKKHRPDTHELKTNCIAYYRPAYTWTRRIARGNMDSILQANFENLKRFENQFGKVDLIHAHVAHPGGFIAMKMSEQLGVPFVITEHMSPFPFAIYEKNNGLNSLIATPMRKAHRTICVSDALKKMVNEKIGVDSHVMHNFIDNDFFSLKQENTVNNSQYTLLFVGRLVPQKGVDILIHALKIVLEKDHNFQLIICGSGEKELEYQNLSHQLGIHGKIHWLGDQSRESVRDQLQASDALVLPSRHENNPLVISEAHSCGTPVVATRCGGSEEMIDTSNGLCAEPENIIDLATQIFRIKKHASEYHAATIRQNYLLKNSSGMKAEQLNRHYKNVLDDTFST